MVGVFGEVEVGYVPSKAGPDADCEEGLEVSDLPRKHKDGWPI